MGKIAKNDPAWEDTENCPHCNRSIEIERNDVFTRMDPIEVGSNCQNVFVVCPICNNEIFIDLYSEKTWGKLPEKSRMVL